jgi:hypothetical protein
MEPEDLDIERITEDRRKAIEQNIHVVSIEDLKSLGEKLFPFLDHPWRPLFSSSRGAQRQHIYHATTDDDLKSFTVPQRRKACVHAG